MSDLKVLTGLDHEGRDGCRGVADGTVPAFVVKAREDLQIAHEVRALLG